MPRNLATRAPTPSSTSPNHMKLNLPNLASLGPRPCGRSVARAAIRLPPPRSTANGAMPTKSPTARTPIPAIGKSPACRCPSTGAISPTPFPTFPKSLTDALITQAKLPGILGNKHASGTEIIEEFGEEHMRAGKPIVYTSADSVIQIAAHEENFGLQRLYDVCKIARELTYELNIGRVIARPFIGTRSSELHPHRQPQGLSPCCRRRPRCSIVLTKAGRDVITVGKIGDIYAHSGTGREVKVAGNAALMEQPSRQMAEPQGWRLPDDQFRRFRHATTATAAIPSAMAGRWKISTRSCPKPMALNARRRSAGPHRRPRQRPHLERHRPHPRMRAGSELMPTA